MSLQLQLGIILAPERGSSTRFRYCTLPFQLLDVSLSSFSSPLSPYADAAAFSSDYRASSAKLTDHASDVAERARSKTLSVSLAKLHSSCSPPTPTQTLALLSRVTLSVQRHYKVLCVIFDAHISFTPYINYATTRYASQLRILKALARARWGQDQETPLVSYRIVLCFFMQYAGSIWFPNASSFEVAKLQLLQHAGLRIASGFL